MSTAQQGFNESCFKVSSNFLPHLINILENLIYISGMSISGLKGPLVKTSLDKSFDKVVL